MKTGKTKRERRLLYHTAQKIRRSFTAFLPADKNRRGECLRCGECCKMGWTCPFLRYVKEDGRTVAACVIRRFRPLNCRGYPRTKSEQLVLPCGYHFRNGNGDTESQP